MDESRQPIVTVRLSKHCTLNVYQDTPFELESEFSVMDGYETMTGILVNPGGKVFTSKHDPELQSILAKFITNLNENNLIQLVEKSIESKLGNETVQ